MLSYQFLALWSMDFGGFFKDAEPQGRKISGFLKKRDVNQSMIRQKTHLIYLVFWGLEAPKAPIMISNSRPHRSMTEQISVTLTRLRQVFFKCQFTESNIFFWNLRFWYKNNKHTINIGHKLQYIRISSTKYSIAIEKPLRYDWLINMFDC